jgi:glycine cleavage system H protein
MDPSKLWYAPTHEWAAIHEDVATVGITKFAVDQLTDVTYLELPKVGTIVKPGDEVGVIESVKSTSSIYSPLAGEIIAVNSAAAADTAVINADPFGEGWLFRLKLAPDAKTDHLLSKARYDEQIASDGH